MQWLQLNMLKLSTFGKTWSIEYRVIETSHSGNVGVFWPSFYMCQRLSAVNLTIVGQTLKVFEGFHLLLIYWPQ